MKKILIAGATGTAGQSLTKFFSRQKNYDVYGISHNPENIEKLECTPILVNLTNGDDVLKAVGNIKPDVILSSVMGRGDNASEQERSMGRNLVHAAVNTEVGVFGYVSVFRADQKTGIPHFDVKADIEAFIKKSGLNYLIIRPATFMDGLFMPWFLQAVKENNTIVNPNNREVKISYIHTRDIADIIGYALQHNLLYETYTMGGKPLSMADLQEILSQKRGTPVVYQQLTLEQVEKTIGSDVAVMIDYFNNNGFEVTENILPKGYQPDFRRFEEEIDQYL